MARLLFARMAAALGMTSLAVLFVGLIPFFSIEPTAGAGLAPRTPALLVNRAFKSDRLPLPAEINSAVSRGETKRPPRPHPEIPVGCDAAFSPISAPQLAFVYGRCLT